MKTRIFSYLSVSLIVLIQFLIVPNLGNLNYSGKLFLFSLFVLISYAFLIRNNEKIYISPVVLIFLTISIFFYSTSVIAKIPFLSFMYSSILLMFILYSIFVFNIYKGNILYFDLIIKSIILSGLIFSLFGIYEYVHFFNFGSIDKFLIPYFLPPDHSQRISGIYGQPNLFSLFLAIVMFSYIYWYMTCENKFEGKISNIIKFFPLFIVSFTFYLTGSRSGFLSFFVVFCILFWIVSSKKVIFFNIKERKIFYHVVICLFLSFLSYKLLPNIVSLFSDASLSVVHRPMGAAGTSSDVRFVFWISAVLMFIDHPWFGVGLDNYGFFQDSYGILAKEIIKFVPYEAMKDTFWAHNEILQLLAEGGFFVFILALSLIVLYAYSWGKNIKSKDKHFLFSSLFVLLFIIQSMFSWTLRHPPLLILFFTFLSIILTKYNSFEIVINKRLSYLAKFIVFVAFIFILNLFVQEYSIGNFKKDLFRSSNLSENISKMEDLSQKSYSSYRVLSGALPIFTKKALEDDSSSLARKIVPFYERLVEIEGSQWQWFYLARLYLKVDDEDKSRHAINKALELMPSSTVSWSFLHYLNILKAARETGRPIESFWPQGKKIDVTQLELNND